jgi:hypothetical protein
VETLAITGEGGVEHGGVRVLVVVAVHNGESVGSGGRGRLSGAQVARDCLCVRDSAQEGDRLMYHRSLVSVELALEGLGEPGFAPSVRRLQ